MGPPRAIVGRTYEAFNARDFNARDLNAFREVLDKRVELVMSGIAVHGLAAVTEFVATTGRARPGLRIEPEWVFVEAGDTRVTEVRMVDTAAAGPGKDAGPLESSACGLYGLVGGRIVEWRI